MADEYISKEAFTKWIDETFCKKCEAEKRDYHHCRCGSCEYDYMRCDIEAFPAADVQPVRHARNVYNTVPEHCEFKCSLCGAELSTVYGGRNHFGMDGGNLNYCPNCGAKMDGGEA